MDITQFNESGRLDRGRIASLDGARGVAILLVLIAHVSQTSGFATSPTLRDLFRHGGFGVQIFFVISGFLITNLMLREIDRAGRLSLRGFYLRRALRILPAYLSYLGVLLILCVAGVITLTGLDWTEALTYTINFTLHPTWQVGHIWSLSIEEHFYLLWPLVFVLGGAVLARRTAIFFIVFCFAARWVILLKFRDPDYAKMAERWTFTQLDIIAFGCLLALLTWDKPWRDRLDRLCNSNKVIGASVALVIFALLVMTRSGKVGVGLTYTFNSFLIALLLWAAIRRCDTMVGRILNHRVLSGIGVISYSLYLWQQIFLNRTSDAWAYRFPQNIIFACVAACVSYAVIERPFLRMKSRLAAAKHGAVERERVKAEPVVVGAVSPVLS
jgi:peptidoglycan/LPS O-acetylase OafA/YrhL